MENYNHGGNPTLRKEWDLEAKLPHGKCLVSSKWMFIIKHNVDGSINRFKAQLVVKDFIKSYRIDYQDSFVLVTKLNTF